MVQDINATFSFVRKSAFCVASVFGLLVFILGASITNVTTSRRHGGYFTFAALAIATGILTILSLPPLLWVSINRKSAIPTMITVELVWTWFLWVLWLACAGHVASTPWLDHCNFFSGKSKSVCQQTEAITAFSFLTWLILLAYNVFLFSLVLRQHMRGNTAVWTGFVLETDYAAAGGKNVEAGLQPMQDGRADYQQTMPPSQMQAVSQQPYVPAAQPS